MRSSCRLRPPTQSRTDDQYPTSSKPQSTAWTADQVLTDETNISNRLQQPSQVEKRSTPAAVSIMSAAPTLYILYNADASVMGKLSYGYKKLTNKDKDKPTCAACDITHGGLSLDETPQWKAAKKDLVESGAVKDVKQFHRDELDQDVRLSSDHHIYLLRSSADRCLLPGAYRPRDSSSRKDCNFPWSWLRMMEVD